ncbi:MAG: hypothetical protein C0616_13390 [Desulfuromonas sp.]|nr:MAG: hypothetical protein C0616_13390 [Desulfuromonas sp.]
MEKIGQVLLREKLITKDHLKKALDHQALFGGRIGSQLVEMGALEEEQLGQVLGKRYRIPYVVSKQLAKVPEDILPLLSVELAAKYSAIPLKLQKQKLFLAMIDPTDFRAAEEIGFRTGYAVNPVVAPETAMLTHLERYYDIARKKLGISISDVPTPALPKEKVEVKPKEDKAVWLGGEDSDEVLDAWDKKLLEERLQQTQKAKQERPSAEEAPQPTTMGGRLSACPDRDAVAGVVTDYIAKEFRRGGLFLIRRNVACGWSAVFEGSPVPEFENFEVNLSEPSVLQTVAMSGQVYFGPVPPSPANQRLFKILGEDMPDMVLAAPVIAGQKALAVIVVANRKLNLQAYVEEIGKLSHLLAMSIEILILQNKLSSMDL